MKLIMQLNEVIVIFILLLKVKDHITEERTDEYVNLHK